MTKIVGQSLVVLPAARYCGNRPKPLMMINIGDWRDNFTVYLKKMDGGDNDGRKVSRVQLILRFSDILSGLA